mmetsp:Transcript_1477/g.3068  ORF Transcript_1477/g.3068 Transcript_1477/m.3068 type:complete len:210 (+) Transcript_1477:777-1406(+)
MSLGREVFGMTLISNFPTTSGLVNLVTFCKCSRSSCRASSPSKPLSAAKRSTPTSPSSFESDSICTRVVSSRVSGAPSSAAALHTPSTADSTRAPASPPLAACCRTSSARRDSSAAYMGSLGWAVGCVDARASSAHAASSSAAVAQSRATSRRVAAGTTHAPARRGHAARPALTSLFSMVSGFHPEMLLVASSPAKSEVGIRRFSRSGE